MDRRLYEANNELRFLEEMHQRNVVNEKRIQKLERDVEWGKIVLAERRAAIPGELELEHAHD